MKPLAQEEMRGFSKPSYPLGLRGYLGFYRVLFQVGIEWKGEAGGNCRGVVLRVPKNDRTHLQDQA